MRFNLILAVAALTLCVSCGPKPATEEASTETADAACPDDGPRLPQTGVCVGRAWAYLDDAKGAMAPTLPDGCTWSVNETLLPGDEALLYRAASCKGVTAKLAYAGGAHSATITIETSALAGDALKGYEAIKLFGTDPDPQGALKQAIAELPRPRARIARSSRRAWMCGRPTRW